MPASPPSISVVPERPVASASGGLWFVFAPGADRIALWVSPTGLGRVHVNDRVETEQRWLGNAWRHRFVHAGAVFELVLSVQSNLRGECECTLLRDGETVATLAAAYVVRRSPWATPAWVAVGVGLGVLYSMFALAPWQLALALVAALLLGRRLRAGNEYLIGTPDEVRASRHRIKLRAGRALPGPLRPLGRLGRNVRAGARLVFARRLRAGAFRATLGQVVLLVLLNVALVAAIGYLRVDPPRVFIEWGVIRLAALYLLFFALVVGMVSWLGARRHAVLLSVALLSASVWPSVGLLILDRIVAGSEIALDTGYGFAVLGILALWSLFYTARSLRLVSARRWPRIAAAAVGHVAVTFGAALLVPQVGFWYTDYGSGEGDDASPWAPMDVEGIYYRQFALLDDALDAVAPQQPGRSDVFFLGFAPYAAQDVFMQEVAFVRDTVAARFGSSQRSLVLVNNKKSVDRLPMANPSNLALVLDAFAERMDVDEDVLFLYLTSHGSADASLSVEFADMMPNPLTAQDLRAMLDESGIRWRIVVISACYSGSFIEALQDEQTLVLTAAHADRTSFGCSNDRALTYFAEHLFEQEWSQGGDLLQAFENARASLETREVGEGFEYSDPQHFLGAMMGDKLRQLEAPAGGEPVLTGSPLPECAQPASC